MESNQSIVKLAIETNPVYYKGDLTLCDVHWYFDDIVVSYDKFYFIKEGECTIKIDGLEYTARPGQLFLLPFNSTQSLYTSPDKTVNKYWFHCLLPCGGKDLTELIRLPHFFEVAPADRLMIEQLFQSILAKEKAPGLEAKLEQKADILRLLSYYLRHVEEASLQVCHNDKLTFILAYIEEHLAENLSLQELSSLLHYHPNYFVRFFKEETGQTPMAYIRNQRIVRARRLMQEEDSTVRDVSMRVGFQNPQYFSRYFKKACGISPIEYQRLSIEKHTARGIAYIKPPYRPAETLETE